MTPLIHLPTHPSQINLHTPKPHNANHNIPEAKSQRANVQVTIQSVISWANFKKHNILAAG